MKRASVVCAVLMMAAPMCVAAAQEQGPASGEYARHFAALADLSVAVAKAMPVEEYAFKPDPPSMTFGEQMMHIAQTNMAFCHGLKDEPAAAAKNASGKDEIVQELTASFRFCSDVIAGLTEGQLKAVHNSPDGRLPGRDVLLAMFLHVAHHRGQAEVYLRDKGIAPPPYKV